MSKPFNHFAKKELLQKVYLNPHLNPELGSLLGSLLFPASLYFVMALANVFEMNSDS